MDLIYSDEHRLQDGAAELIDGRLQPPVECPMRADAIREALLTAGIGTLREPSEYGLGPVLRVHDADYVEFLSRAWELWSASGRTWHALPLNWVGRGMSPVRPESIDGLLGYYSFDAGTPITPGTWRAARAAANVALTGATAILDGAEGAFALCRPPGHHAAADCYGGYCFLNNAAIAAQGLRVGAMDRVAVLDVDYHHGNGTQSIFYARADVLFVSIHADPAHEFPYFSGYARETGAEAGEGCTLNLPLAPGTSWEGGYRAALEAALERLRGFAPDGLVVSLGVDTFEGDPISRFRLQAQDYPKLGRMIRGLGVPTLFVMEGGYALEALGANVAAVLGGFLEG